MTSLWIIYRAYGKWSENGGTRLGAALAYYALFSIGPLLLIAIHICGYFYGEEAAAGEVHRRLDAIMGKEIAQQIETLVDQAGKPQETFWTPAISVLFLTGAALGAFLHVRGSLCVIWKLDPPTGKSWLGTLWDYLLSLSMIAVTSSLLLGSMAVGIAMTHMEQTLHEHWPDSTSFWYWFEVTGSLVFLTLLFAASYHTLSGGRIPLGYVFYGAIVAAGLFQIGKSLLSYYIVVTLASSVYGAAGTLVVFLIWIYYSSQVLFFGAELIQARRTRHEWLYGQMPEAQG